jgi:hypothetical protein
MVEEEENEQKECKPCEKWSSRHKEIFKKLVSTGVELTLQEIEELSNLQCCGHCQACGREKFKVKKPRGSNQKEVAPSEEKPWMAEIQKVHQEMRELLEVFAKEMAKSNSRVQVSPKPRAPRRNRKTNKGAASNPSNKKVGTTAVVKQTKGSVILVGNGKGPAEVLKNLVKVQALLRGKSSHQQTCSRIPSQVKRQKTLALKALGLQSESLELPKLPENPPKRSSSLQEVCRSTTLTSWLSPQGGGMQSIDPCVTKPSNELLLPSLRDMGLLLRSSPRIDILLPVSQPGVKILVTTVSGPRNRDGKPVVLVEQL